MARWIFRWRLQQIIRVLCHPEEGHPRHCAAVVRAGGDLPRADGKPDADQEHVQRDAAHDDRGGEAAAQGSDEGHRQGK